MYHILYKTECDENGRFYYGAHSTNDINDGYLGSGKILRLSIKKHGEVSHSREVISLHESREELLQAEATLITQDTIKNALCMNIITGGTGGFSHFNSCSEHQRKASKKSAIAQEKLRQDPAWRENKSQRISFGNRQSYREGRRTANPPNWTGLKHSHTTRKRMSEASKGKIDGALNPNFGRVWIFYPATLESKPIPKEKLDAALNEGWILGRKMPRR